MSIRDLHIEDILRIARKHLRLLDNYYVPNDVKIKKVKEFLNLVIQFEYGQILELEQKGESVFIILCEDIIRQSEDFITYANVRDIKDAKNLLNIIISIEDYLGVINDLPWLIGRKISGREKRNIKSKLRKVLHNLKGEDGKPVRGTRVFVELCGSLARGYSDWKLINGGNIPKPTDYNLPKEYRLRSKSILKKIDAELNVPYAIKHHMADIDLVIVNKIIFDSIPKKYRFKDWSVKIGEKYSTPVSDTLSKIHQKLINTKIGGIRNRYVNYILLRDEEGYKKYMQGRQEVVDVIEKKIGKKVKIKDVLILDEIIK